MSTQELAEAVNSYLWREHGTQACLDETDIGKLERGVIRWPGAWRREAFRAILGVANDSELGFYINRSLSTVVAGTPRPSLADGTEVSVLVVAEDATGVSSAECTEPVLADSSLCEHWAGMLRVLAAADNALGVHGLLDVVRHEVRLIDQHRRAANGRLREQLTTVSARWLEFGSWVADNQQQTRTADRWLGTAGSLAGHTGDHALAAYVQMRRAQRAVEAGDPGRAAALAEPVIRDSSLPPRVRALAAVRHAQARAQDRDCVAVCSSLGQAYHLLDNTASGGDDPAVAALTGHCTSAYVRGYEAYCRLLLGEPHAAIHDLRLVLADWPTTQRLDEGLFRAVFALAHQQAGQPEAAHAEAARARQLGIQTGSRRTLTLLNLLALPMPIPGARPLLPTQ